jgi:hypothetical protein
LWILLILITNLGYGHAIFVIISPVNSAAKFLLFVVDSIGCFHTYIYPLSFVVMQYLNSYCGGCGCCSCCSWACFNRYVVLRCVFLTTCSTVLCSTTTSTTYSDMLYTVFVIMYAVVVMMWLLRCAELTTTPLHR